MSTGECENPAATRRAAETYTAKAAELIAVYGIDRTLLAQSDPTSDTVGDRVACSMRRTHSTRPAC
ncbi:MAG: hypothetical protein M3393_06530 [Actinomycetota bacterium]|nr:hypothetical protein [Actinomycetota bacterium]